MSKRLLAVIAALAVLGLAAGAVPTFTADTGTVTVSVTAQAPAAPCVQLRYPPGTTVNFGTLPFSPVGPTLSTGSGDVAPVFRSCSTANEQITITGSNISQNGVDWETSSSSRSPRRRAPGPSARRSSSAAVSRRP